MEPLNKDRAPFQELQRFNIFTPTPNHPDKNSVLNWGVRDGFPFLSVRTNVPDDAENRFGMITVSFSPIEFKILLDSMNHIITNGKNGDREHVECWTTRGQADGTRSERFKTGTVYYGKSKTGMIFISVQAEGRPKIIFEFKNSTFHPWFKSDGTEVDAAEMSVRHAAALLRTLDQIYSQLTNQFRPKLPPGAPRPNGGGKSGGKKETSTYEDFDDIVV